MMKSKSRVVWCLNRKSSRRNLFNELLVEWCITIWAFTEFTNARRMQDGIFSKIEVECDSIIATILQGG